MFALLNTSSDKIAEKQSERDLSVYDIHLTVSNPFPLAIDLSSLVESSIMKARLKSAVKSQLTALLQAEYMLKGLECLYWLVICKQFFEESSVQVQELLKQKLSTYLFEMMVKKMNQLKEEFVEYVPLVYSHCIFTDIFMRFPNSRPLITEAFIVSTVHLTFLSLYGFATSDVFARQKLVALYQSQVFKLEIKEETAQEPEERRVSNEAIRKVKSVAGGVDFAKELYRERESRQKQRSLQAMPEEEKKKVPLPKSELKLQRIVRHYSTTQSRGASRPSTSAARRRVDVFNCTGLSPIVTRQLRSSESSAAVQIPFKPKVQIVHPLDLKEAMPKSIRMLKSRQDDLQRKLLTELEEKQKEEELIRLRFNQFSLQRRFRLGEGLSYQGVEHSPCFEDDIRLRNELRDQHSSIWAGWGEK